LAPSAGAAASVAAARRGTPRGATAAVVAMARVSDRSAIALLPPTAMVTLSLLRWQRIGLHQRDGAAITANRAVPGDPVRAGTALPLPAANGPTAANGPRGLSLPRAPRAGRQISRGQPKRPGGPGNRGRRVHPIGGENSAWPRPWALAITCPRFCGSRRGQQTECRPLGPSCLSFAPSWRVTPSRGRPPLPRPGATGRAYDRFEPAGSRDPGHRLPQAGLQGRRYRQAGTRECWGGPPDARPSRTARRSR